MNFGEKLFKLRKEKGLSQEALAQHLGTTRQAVSKWENNQGFPETEKLLQLSNIFEVSTDFLLKDEKAAQSAADERGYYVSREMAEGYITNTKRVCRYISIGFMFCIFTGIPYTLFAADPSWRYTGMAACVVAGIIFFVLGSFAEEDKYKVLKQEPLLFDYNYMKELSDIYTAKRKKYIAVTVPCTILFILGLLSFILTGRGYIPWSSLSALIFLGFGVGILGFAYFSGMMEAYELLVKNEQFSSRLWFKLKKKIRHKIDQL